MGRQESADIVHRRGFALVTASACVSRSQTQNRRGSGMPTDDVNPKVREQYEQLPYPACDPADEQRRLIRTWLDDPPMINHYGFGGRQTFRDGFRALVAGG